MMENDGIGWNMAKIREYDGLGWNMMKNGEI